MRSTAKDSRITAALPAEVTCGRSTYSSNRRRDNWHVRRPRRRMDRVHEVALVTSATSRYERGAPAARSHEGNAAALQDPVSTDRQGSDYKDFDLPQDKYELCAQACDDDAQCRTFVYTPRGHEGPNARCWLKSVTPPERAVPPSLSASRRPPSVRSSTPKPLGAPKNCSRRLSNRAMGLEPDVQPRGVKLQPPQDGLLRLAD